MNAPFPTPKARERHKFTVDDLFDFIERGVVPKRSVLLDGGIYDMAADGDPHIEFAMRLQEHITVTLHRKGYFVGVQTTLRLSRYNAPQPDIYVLAGGPPKGEVPADRILLVVEVADSSLDDDLSDSASRYARHDVREFWVVDVKKRVIHVHRDPADDVYPPPKIFGGEDRIHALLIPELTVILNQVLDQA
jgi:Uma2 family endonuclease